MKTNTIKTGLAVGLLLLGSYFSLSFIDNFSVVVFGIILVSIGVYFLFSMEDKNE